MSEQSKQVVRTFIEAFGRGDADTAATCLAPDAVAIAKGFGKISGPRPYEFIVGTTRLFPQMMPTGLRPTFSNFIAEGDRVAVEFEGDATLANGDSYANQYCMVFTLEGGKIKRVHEYFCTVLADQKLGPLMEDLEAQRKAAVG
jgi:ketosteroid isomerase-like protein